MCVNTAPQFGDAVLGGLGGDLAGEVCPWEELKSEGSLYLQCFLSAWCWQFKT